MTTVHEYDKMMHLYKCDNCNKYTQDRCVVTRWKLDKIEGWAVCLKCESKLDEDSVFDDDKRMNTRIINHTKGARITNYATRNNR